jgi:hypothetical protein
MPRPVFFFAGRVPFNFFAVVATIFSTQFRPRRRRSSHHPNVVKHQLSLVQDYWLSWEVIEEAVSSSAGQSSPAQATTSL